MNYSSLLEDEIKKADRELVRTWNALHYGQDMKQLPDIMQSSFNEQSTEENEDPTTSFLRHQAIKEEREATIPFEMWAKVVPPDRLSRWSSEYARNQEEQIPQSSSVDRIVKNNIVGELYQILLNKNARKNTVEETDKCNEINRTYERKFTSITK